MKTASGFFGLLFLISLLAPAVSSLANPSIKRESTETMVEEVWEKILLQQKKLESESRKLETPLREVYGVNEFQEKYPLLPYGSMLQENTISNGIEIRIASNPTNLTRTNKPYIGVAIVFQNEDGEIVSKGSPNNEETKRTLNLGSDWKNVEMVEDSPKINKK
jgi:hypothetical protein